MKKHGPNRLQVRPVYAKARNLIAGQMPAWRGNEGWGAQEGGRARESVHFHEKKGNNGTVLKSPPGGAHTCRLAAGQPEPKSRAASDYRLKH